jgi:hypothetical protein
LPPAIPPPGRPDLQYQPISSLIRCNSGDRVLLRLINLGYMEQAMRLFQDIKKELHYNKCEGSWYWSDRDESDNLDAWHGPYQTATAAVHDAVEPYVSELEDPEEKAVPGARHDFKTDQYIPTVNGKDTSPTSFDADRALEIAEQQIALSASSRLGVPAKKRI